MNKKRVRFEMEFKIQHRSKRFVSEHFVHLALRLTLFILSHRTAGCLILEREVLPEQERLYS